MKVTFQGAPLTLKGNQLKVGDKAPDFTVIDNELNPLKLDDTKGKRVFLSVPSIDTPVCDMEVRRFNTEASKLNNVTVYTISMDLPFAQARWCGTAGIENVKTVSDYKDREFGENYGVYINELGLLSRAVFVVDENDKVIYVEYLEEITEEPNYNKVLEILR
ncbi:thiol peroxidase [Romboutsia hominis]|nr:MULTISPECIES: thiol peroxidase [Romboutsia]MCH1959612.1 thiol peroxidase [Romboutsia hominis]MCH1969965.1 thiol peroxidase [Romboutsia hominis]MDB8790819.1 thiol peroxidase [Romboutsia sp. 1001216sp1]